MRLNVVRCQRCGNCFQSDLDHCPTCGKLSPPGMLHLLLKWLAVLIFLIVIVFILYSLIHSHEPRG